MTVPHTTPSFRPPNGRTLGGGSRARGGRTISQRGPMGGRRGTKIQFRPGGAKGTGAMGRRESARAGRGSADSTPSRTHPGGEPRPWYPDAVKPHPRIRKTVKWGGAVVTVLLMVVWVGSGWWSVLSISRHYGLHVAGGSVTVLHLDSSFKSEPGWQIAKHGLNSSGVRFSYSPAFLSFAGGWTAIIPLWWLVPVPLLASIFAWRLDARARGLGKVPRCPRCGYDRTGLALLAGCPECGSGQVGAAPV